MRRDPTAKKLLQEHPVFDEFTEFSTETGQLTPVTQAVFDQRLSAAPQRHADTGPGIDRHEGDGYSVFTGDLTPSHTRFPRRIYWQITRNCNLHCAYCFMKSEPGLAHVPTEALKTIARYMGLNGLLEARLSGGEPTSHPRFLDIVDTFRQHGIYVSVATNGVMSRRILDGLAERKNLWLIVSLEGGKAVHDSLRPGTFDPIIENLRYFKEKNPAARIRLTTVVSRKNKNDIFEVGRIAKSVGAESMTMIPLRPAVRSPDMLRELLSAREFEGAIKSLVRAGEAFGIAVRTTIETEYADGVQPDPIVRKRAACAAGREATNLDYDARRDLFFLYGCSYCPAPDLSAAPELRKPFVAGEFSPEDPGRFLEIWQDNEAWRIYRDPAFKSSECFACRYYTENRCIGSCPIQNLDYSVLDLSKDMTLQLKTQLSRSGEWYCYKRIFERKWD